MAVGEDAPRDLVGVAVAGVGGRRGAGGGVEEDRSDACAVEETRAEAAVAAPLLETVEPEAAAEIAPLGVVQVDRGKAR